MEIKLELIRIQKPEDDMSVNVIIGQSHFIKTVEDIHEALVTTVSGIKYGLAFCEASGKKLIRTHSTDAEMLKLAEENAKLILAGHSFVLFLKDTFPLNILNKIKDVPEVARIFCATANPLEVIVGVSESGRGIMGVIDGETTPEVETEEDKKEKHDLLRKIGYKL